jgi:PAP2 superfamily
MKRQFETIRESAGRPGRFGFCASVVLGLALSGPAHANEVTDWEQVLFQAALSAQTSPLNMARFSAIYNSAVFDAVNGIERRFTPIYVQPKGPRSASVRAAATMAAYTILVKLYPSQRATFDSRLVDSFAAIGGGPTAETQAAIARGMAWGQNAADQIWDWRSNDGFTANLPPFLGGTNAGQWRPTPPAFAPGVGTNFVAMSPWVLKSPSQFRPYGPPPMGSVQYANDFNEAKIMGSASSSVRSTDQTVFSQFWNASTGPYFWNQIAVGLILSRNLSVPESARLLALMNLAMGDAIITCFEAKYHFSFWRPVTAIPAAADDGNSSTDADSTWLPLITTPAFPEYPSAHSTVSSAAATVLADYFGDNTSFSVKSDVLTDVPARAFPSFTAALAEIKNARIFGGIHFRTACDDGQALGIQVGNYILEHAIRPARGQRGNAEVDSVH